MMAPDVTVKIMTHDDNRQIRPGEYGILVDTASERSKTGRAYAAYIVKSLDHVGSPFLGMDYAQATAYALAEFNLEHDRQPEYHAAIKQKMFAALAEFNCAA